MNRIFSYSNLVVALALAAAPVASAQLVFEALDLDELEGALLAVVGQERSFSAMASLRAQDEGMAQSLEMRLIVRAGRLRVELDVDQVNLRQLGADDIEMMKRIGLGQVTEIILPDKDFSYVILPLAKAYCEARPQDFGREARPKLRVLEKKASGEEVVGQHPCMVNRVTLAAAGDANAKLEVTTWEARDLKDFPVKIAVRNGEQERATIQFKDVDLAPPDEWLFEPPVGWRRYPGIEPMMEERLREAGGMFAH